MLNNAPRVTIFKAWLSPHDWEDLKRRLDIKDDRPIILLYSGSPLLNEFGPKLKRPQWPKD